MSDRRIEAKTIVKQSSLGHPMAALGADENLNKVILGVIVGIATAVSINEVVDAETGEVKKLASLRGSFRAIPRDEKRPIVTSARLGLPAHILQPIVDLLSSDSSVASVELAWELGVERSKNAAGYSWFGSPLLRHGADPLEELQQRMESVLLPSSMKADASRADAAMTADLSRSDAAMKADAATSGSKGRHRATDIGGAAV